jgi:hypothetical protein
MGRRKKECGVEAWEEEGQGRGMGERRAGLRYGRKEGRAVGWEEGGGMGRKRAG